MQVVLFEPKIPQNVGNIARTCAATGCPLRLVPPMGFELAEAKLKRAGLDYWPHVDMQVLPTAAFHEELRTGGDRCWFFSSKGKLRYDQVSYNCRDWLIFGSETAGIPGEILSRFANRTLLIPKRNDIRCLNLATAAGIAIYEAWRQQGFAALD